MIDPGQGNYFQRRPIVQTSGGHSVSVLWYDDRAGSRGIATTRLLDLHPLEWFKEGERNRSSAGAAQSFLVSQGYPEPVVLSRNPSITFRLGVETGVVEVLRIYDALGRIVHGLHQETASQGVLRVALPDGMNPGVYFIAMKTASGPCIRRFHVVH
jgi:hypothetical protein